MIEPKVVRAIEKTIFTRMCISNKLITAGNLKLSSLPDIASDSLTLTLRAILLGCKVSETVITSVRVPKTWWDAVKIRWAPWLGVEYRDIPIFTEHWHVCPHINLPQNTHHFNFLTGL